ncbi:DUF624 domain-containing protein [Caldifermentibacillus hisashii]|uniref:YesL family protein n=1 Tax=Caldifermentibacillus hisashii TaxID=996558 RepID=UPI0031FC30E0
MLNSVEKINHFLMRILNLVYLNFLWILFTLLGLVIFGIGPSTYAIVSICRQWVKGNDDLSVLPSFWKYYKESFKESVIISWIYLLVGYILTIDLLYVSNWYLRVLFLLIAFVYLLSLIFIYPTMAHYNWKGIFLKIKMAFLFGFSQLQYSLVLILVIITSYLVAVRIFPGILAFFGISFLFFIITWTANQIFTRMEMMNAN